MAMSINITSEGNENRFDSSGQESSPVQVKLTAISTKLLQLQEENSRSYLEQGRLLLEAKSLFCKHGEWLEWLKEHTSFSTRQSQRLMRVAEWFGDTTPGSYLDFTKAYILTRIPKSEEDNFLKKCDPTDAHTNPLAAIQSMSECEFEKAIREYLASTPHVPRTRKEGRTEVDYLAALSPDNVLDEFCRLETAMSGLVKDIINRRIDNEEYGMVISEIRRLCEDTLGKLPSDDVEIE